MPGMSPNTELRLHTLAAFLLFFVVLAAALGAGYLLADLQGLKGKRLDSWMLWSFGVALVTGFLAFFGYQAWILPKRLKGLQPPPTKEQVEGERQRLAAMAKHEAEKEALRVQLRATPGLERYAELVGRSTIRTVEDARVREARVSQLQADPVKAKYAERVFKGEAITDAMIAYWEDPSARILCAHLAALETDVRRANPNAHPVEDNALDANLTFDFDAVKAKYALGDPVSFWREHFGPLYWGRGEDYYDGKERIRCEQHGCEVRGADRRTPFPPAAPGASR